MNTAVIKVELECLRFTFAEHERCRRLGRAGEAVQLGQVERTVGLFDVAEDAAGADRGELLIITDQPDIRTTTNSELHGGVEGEGVGHAGFIDDHQCRRAGRGRPVQQLAMVKGPGEFGEGVGADSGLLAKNSGRGRGRGEADDLARRLGSMPG